MNVLYKHCTNRELLANIFSGKPVWNLRYWKLPWARQNCKLTNILMKFMANKHHCLSQVHPQEKQWRPEPVVSFLCIRGVWRVSHYASTHRHLTDGEKEKEKKKERKKERKTIGNSATGRGKGYLLFCYHLLHTQQVEKTRIQSQPLRDFCLFVILLKYRLRLVLPAAFIAENPLKHK